MSFSLFHHTFRGSKRSFSNTPKFTGRLFTRNQIIRRFQSTESGAVPTKKPSFPWIGASVFVLMFGGIVLYFWNFKRNKYKKLAIESAGKAKVGGDWSMIDHTGHIMTSADIRGKYRLMYFGFTFCPDVGFITSNRNMIRTRIFTI
eukprot:TRINITY_DN2245_c0_g1_i1.p1 TRINITY_DN2245_c0_g1~~TRINITY_DN2245_c0_g1_i1.p1  ORF type:complete len:146 (+),score=9.20 TRINITY_DN2245_c0_g1_i1:23-460(+)